MPIIGSAEEGDQITILGVGNGIADTPVVLGGAGSGDKTNERLKDVENKTSSQSSDIRSLKTRASNLETRATALETKTTATVLFSNSSGTYPSAGTPIQLSASITNFDRIDVYFKDTDNNYSSISLYKPTAGIYFTLSSSNVYVNGAGISVKTATCQFATATTVVLRNTNNGLWRGQFVKDSTQELVQFGNYISITNIIGYKF